MTSEELSDLLDHADSFLDDFKVLVHKYAGDDYSQADPHLLTLMQERTSVFQPYIWPVRSAREEKMGSYVYQGEVHE